MLNSEVIFNSTLGADHTTAYHVWSVHDLHDVHEDILQKIFEEEMMYRTKPTTLLQIYCQSMLNSEVTSNRTLDPDDTTAYHVRSVHDLHDVHEDVGADI